MNYENLNDSDKYKISIFIGKVMSNFVYGSDYSHTDAMGLLSRRLHDAARELLLITIDEYVVFTSNQATITPNPVPDT